MPSIHDQLYAACAVPMETEFFGEDITLTPGGTKNAKVVRLEETLETMGDGRQLARVCHVSIPATALATTSDVLAATFDGCEWNLRPLNSAAPDGWWRFEATRRESTERTQPGYRART